MDINENVNAQADIVWKKHRIWGYCPHLTGGTPDEDNNERKNIKALGCGYDRLSSVLAEFINSSPAFLNKLRELTAFPKDIRPYGFRYHKNNRVSVMDGGVGVESIVGGLRDIGIKCVHTSGPTCDHYLFEGDFAPRKSIGFVSVKNIASGDLRVYSSEEWKNSRIKDRYMIIERYRRSVKREL